MGIYHYSVQPEVLEKLILKGMFADKHYREALVSKFKSEYFQSTGIGKIFDIVSYHEKQFGTAPCETVIISGCVGEHRSAVEEALKDINEINFDVAANMQMLFKDTQTYLRDQTRRKGIMNAVLDIEVGRDMNNTLKGCLDVDSLYLSGGDFEQFITADQFIQIDLGEINYHLFPIVSEASVILLNAARGTGKTLFAMYAADAISKGQKFCCWENKSGPQKVLYFDGEVFHKEFQQRVKQMEPNENLITYCRTYAEAQGQKALLLTDEDSRNNIRKFIVDRGIKFVVFDNLASLCVGIDENQKRDYDPINQFFLSLRGLGVSVLVLHHTGKSGSQRGTSGREDNVDTIIQLVDRKDGAAEAKFELYFEKFRGMVTAGTKALVRKRELKCVQDEAGKWVWHFEEARLDRDPDFVAGLLGGKSSRELAASHSVTQYKVKATVDWMLHQNIIQRSGSRKGVSYEITDKGRDYYGEEWGLIEIKMLEMG